MLLEGRIAHLGSYQQLLASGVDLSAFVPPQKNEGEGDGPGQGQGQDANSQSEGLSLLDAGYATQQQQQQREEEDRDTRSLLAADSQSLGSRPPLRRDVPSAFEQQQQQQQGESLASADSAAQLVPLPSFYTKSLLTAGGSFASHAPVRLEGLPAAPQPGRQSAAAAAAACSGGGGGAGSGSTVVDGATTEAATTAAAAVAAAAAVGCLAPLSGEFVNLAVDGIDAAVSETAFMQQQQQQQQGLSADDDSAPQAAAAPPTSSSAAAPDESDPLMPSAAGGNKPHHEQQQHWQQQDTAAFGGSNGGSNGGGCQAGRLIDAEGRAKGQVKRSVYLAYLTAMGPLLLVPLAVLIGEWEACAAAAWGGGGGIWRRCVCACLVGWVAG